MLALAVTVVAADGAESATDVNLYNHETDASPCGRRLEMAAATTMYADTAASASTDVTTGVSKKWSGLGACLAMRICRREMCYETQSQSWYLKHARVCDVSYTSSSKLFLKLREAEGVAEASAQRSGARLSKAWLSSRHTKGARHQQMACFVGDHVQT